MKKPLVVGYRGEIGSYLLQGLIKYMPKALDINCVDIHETKAERNVRVMESDVIFLCTPIEKTLDFFEENKGYLKGKIVVEQTSLKSTLYKAPGFNAKTHECKILSMHILFRPSATPNKEDHWVAVIEPKKWDDEVFRFLADGLGAHIVQYKHWKAHDTDMATSQALLHRILLVLGESLMHSGGSTYMVKRVCELRNRIKNGDQKLYSMIQSNPALPEALEKFKENLEKFKLENYICEKPSAK